MRRDVSQPRTATPGLVAVLPVLLTVILGGCGADSTVVTPRITPSGTRTPTETPASAASRPATVIGVDWQLTELPWASQTMPLQAVTAGGDRIVAAGGSICPMREIAWCYAGIWTAPLDAPGSLEPLASGAEIDVGDAHPEVGPTPGIVDVAWGPDGFVAVGYRGVAGSPLEAAIWWSADGLSWEPVEPDGLPDGAHVAAVTAGGPGYVVVGNIYSPDAPRAAAWSSAEGRTWLRAPDQASFDIGGYIDTGEVPGSGGMLDVGAWGDAVVAVGLWCEGSPPGSCRLQSWRSSDAVTWATVEMGGVELGGVAAVAAATDLIAAVGGTLERGASFTSLDGAAWNAVALSGIPRLEEIVATPHGFIAFSTDSARLTAWTSPDGAAWRAITVTPQPEGVAVFRDLGAAIVGEGVVVVGWAELLGDPALAAFVLTAPVTDLAP